MYPVSGASEGDMIPGHLASPTPWGARPAPHHLATGLSPTVTVPDRAAAAVMPPPVRRRPVTPPRPPVRHPVPPPVRTPRPSVRHDPRPAPEPARHRRDRDGRRALPATRADAMRVTVLIPAHNEAKQITETIASLRRQERPRTTSW